MFIKKLNILICSLLIVTSVYGMEGSSDGAEPQLESLLEKVQDTNSTYYHGKVNHLLAKVRLIVSEDMAESRYYRDLFKHKDEEYSDRISQRAFEHRSASTISLPLRFQISDEKVSETLKNIIGPVAQITSAYELAYVVLPKNSDSKESATQSGSYLHISVCNKDDIGRIIDKLKERSLLKSSIFGWQSSDHKIKNPQSGSYYFLDSKTNTYRKIVSGLPANFCALCYDNSQKPSIPLYFLPIRVKGLGIRNECEFDGQQMSDEDIFTLTPDGLMYHTLPSYTSDNKFDLDSFKKDISRLENTDTCNKHAFIHLIFALNQLEQFKSKKYLEDKFAEKTDKYPSSYKASALAMSGASIALMAGTVLKEYMKATNSAEGIPSFKPSLFGWCCGAFSAGFFGAYIYLSRAKKIIFDQKFPRFCYHNDFSKITDALKEKAQGIYRRYSNDDDFKEDIIRVAGIKNVVIPQEFPAWQASSPSTSN